MGLFDRVFGTDAHPSDEEIVDQIDQEFDKYENTELPNSNQQHEPSFVAKLEFIMDETGNINIHLHWTREDNDTAKNIGYLLFGLNSGLLKNNCAALLSGISQQTPQKHGFMKQIVAGWKEKEQQTPIVKPSQVFGISPQNLSQQIREMGSHQE